MSVGLEMAFLVGSSILGWVIGNKYIKISSNLDEAEKKNTECVLNEEQLYYKDDELNDIDSNLKELLTCSVDLCII